MPPETIVWRFVDGKAGHERQTAGLLNALARLRPISVHPIRGRPPGTLPTPSLAVGAGSECAWRMFFTRRAHAALRVYLMNPPLPRRWFDLCLVPRHDGVAESANVVLTDGVLNDLEAATGPRDGPMLVLVGGPSKHHAWNDAAVLSQIDALLAAPHESGVLLADSRRTPSSMSAALRARTRPGVAFAHHAEVGPDWLPRTLGRAPATWVTADSVSMLFEALTAGSRVGVLAVSERRADRINRIAPTLAARGLVTAFSQWKESGVLVPPAAALAEAARCAALVDARLREREGSC